MGTTLYGTTSEGGTGYGGTVWAVSTTTGKETILHRFQGGQHDGWRPEGGLAYYKGSFYGTTNGGDGRIFKITKSGKKYVEKIVFTFNITDGSEPTFVTPVFDSHGNMYGTTAGGSAYSSGTVFKLAANGKLTTLHNFDQYDGDGTIPQCGVTLDNKGNLYGSTQTGGAYTYGTLYEITAGGSYRTLYSFMGGTDGLYPYNPPVLDKKGNLYGTTENGGSGGYGTVYKFNPKTGQETVLHNFTGGPDGNSPLDGVLVFDKQGNLYGTTGGGGTYTCGTIYKLAPDGTKTILYNFACSPDGDDPMGSVVFDKQGNLYTTTSADGAYSDGAVIKLTP